MTFKCYTQGRRKCHGSIECKWFRISVPLYFFLILCSCYVMQTLVQNRKFSRNIYSVSRQILSPLRFSVFFPQRLIIFNQTFTRLLYVHVYGKLLNLIQLSLNMTELCHIKHNHRVTFHFSLTANCTDFIAKYEWRPNSPDLDPLDYHVWGEILQAFHKLHPKSKTIPELKGAAADLGRLAADNDQQSY